ncbi:MAG: hypothetical protein IKX22_12020 [Prevotella sp.]|nr:hypothetical protein [Prevotella sp.]
MRKFLHFTLLILLATLVSLTAKAVEETVTLTNANIVAADPSADQTSYRTLSITDANEKIWNTYAIIHYHSTATAMYHYLQIRKYASNKAYYIQIPEYGAKITSITMTVSNASKPMTGGGNTATLFFSAYNSTSAAGNGVASGTGDSSVTIDCSNLDLNTGYITASGAVRIWDVTVTYESGSTTIKEDPNLAFSETSVTANYGETFTPPTLTYAEGYDGTITYSSSNSAISVNETTGEVTFGASAINKTTTITATASTTDNYKSGLASYTLTVEANNAITGNLNNSTFETSYSGTITPIADFSSETGYIGNVKVTYAKGTSSNAYINDSEIRLYNGTTLTFTAPDGYCLKALIFNTGLTDCKSDVGSISDEVWSSLEGEEVEEVKITKTTNGALRLNTVYIILAKQTLEKVTMSTAGFVTYVTKNAIDWEKTLAKNTSDVDVHGYKVVQFTQESAVFAEFGVGENETLIPAETPIIIKGQKDVNELVIASSQDGIVAPSNNLLRASDGTVTATAGQHLLVFQKTSDWTEEDPYNNYAFFKLKEGRIIPEGKAYLNGEDVSEEITATTNAAMGIFLLEDLGKPQDTGTTGITQYSVKPNDSWMEDGAVYDLSGRKVAESVQSMNRLAKGIYIVNGRKVVIK